MFQLAGVKAHCTEADEQAGRISAISRQGNAWADKLAKSEARKAGPQAEMVKRHRDLRDRQKAICRWIAEASTRVGKNVGKDTVEVPKSQRQVRVSRSRPGTGKAVHRKPHGPPRL
eukprot:9372030-Karenia_brevis.AAC.1